jgi:hypothetical protein
MAGPMRTFLATLVFLVALAIPATALADAPVVTTEHVDFAVTIPADQNPCGFDLVFTGVGDLNVTTFSDGRQLTQGSSHTRSRASGTRSRRSARRPSTPISQPAP